MNKNWIKAISYVAGGVFAIALLIVLFVLYPGITLCLVIAGCIIGMLSCLVCSIKEDLDESDKRKEQEKSIVRYMQGSKKEAKKDSDENSMQDMADYYSKH